MSPRRRRSARTRGTPPGRWLNSSSIDDRRSWATTKRPPVCSPASGSRTPCAQSSATNEFRSSGGGESEPLDTNITRSAVTASAKAILASQPGSSIVGTVPPESHHPLPTARQATLPAFPSIAAFTMDCPGPRNPLRTVNHAVDLLEQVQATWMAASSFILLRQRSPRMQTRGLLLRFATMVATASTVTCRPGEPLITTVLRRHRSGVGTLIGSIRQSGRTQ